MVVLEEEARLVRSGLKGWKRLDRSRLKKGLSL